MPALGALRQDQRQRAGPERGERSGQRRELGDGFGHREIGAVDDQRIEARAALGLVDLEDGVGIGGVGAEAVDGLGGERDDAAGTQDCGEVRDFARLCADVLHGACLTRVGRPVKKHRTRGNSPRPMTTLLVSQRNFESHVTPSGHPERPDRLRAVEEALEQPTVRRPARGATRRSADLTLAELVHAPGYLEALRNARPAEGIGQIDEDTFISSGSLDAASTALGAGLAALEAVVLGEADNAFCAVRPPGHHAEIETPMGFCLVNTIAVVAREAQRKYGAERVAIVDFDVHHGNGTQDIFKDDPTRVLRLEPPDGRSIPAPGSAERDRRRQHRQRARSRPAATAQRCARRTRTSIFPALEAFAPDILLISAGFDADHRDPLAQLNWVPDGFRLGHAAADGDRRAHVRAAGSFRCSKAAMIGKDSRPASRPMSRR